MTFDTAPPNEHLVIIGNGMAGHRLVTALLARNDRPKHITILGEENTGAYNRILLSPWLAGEIDRDALALPALDAEGVQHRPGERVIRIDRATRSLTFATGERLAYDRLVIATGSTPLLPDVPGITLDNVGGFRTQKDAQWLMQCPPDSSAVVIGGGLLGLEAAEGLRKRGVRVTVLQRSDRVMNRQLDTTAAGWLEQTLARRCITVETGAQVARLDGDHDGRVRSLTLTDGRTLAADCVVVAAGIVPNAALGFAAGLAGDHAIAVDDTLSTSDPAIMALGECCEFQGATFGLVEPIRAQVEVLTHRLCGTQAHYHLSPTATRLKVSNIDLYTRSVRSTPNPATRYCATSMPNTAITAA
ncbi:NAD(P)/FAD-dependent oxidoreductase [Kushneria phosphatilytica]|uniref:NAD(P)/FAD-dependent oxidoreductase n=1 Tax=Kushneria phosphatilytica TaxID=657387 RepID=UPI000B2F7CD4|nr:FAD-dependent oxidoreductase [Kushneria phosphatilytica]